jgi:hypothetical protein
MMGLANGFETRPNLTVLLDEFGRLLGGRLFRSTLFDA